MIVYLTLVYHYVCHYMCAMIECKLPKDRRTYKHMMRTATDVNSCIVSSEGHIV